MAIGSNGFSVEGFVGHKQKNPNEFLANGEEYYLFARCFAFFFRLLIVTDSSTAYFFFWLV